MAGHVPAEEHSPNAKGIYPKVLSLLLTCLTGGTRFSDIGSWMHGREVVAACFGVNLKHLESKGLRYIVAMRLSDYVQTAIRMDGRDVMSCRGARIWAGRVA